MPKRDQVGFDRTVLVGGALFILALMSVASAQDPPGSAREPSIGESTFRAKNCQYCHSVAVAGIARGHASEKLRGPDLSTVGVERSVEDVLRFLKIGEVPAGRPAASEGRDRENHWRAFWGTDEEAYAVAGWLVGLRTEGEVAPLD